MKTNAERNLDARLRRNIARLQRKGEQARNARLNDYAQAFEQAADLLVILKRKRNASDAS